MRRTERSCDANSDRNPHELWSPSNVSWRRSWSLAMTSHAVGSDCRPPSLADGPRNDDLSWRPQESSILAGQVVTCSAKGNPAPWVVLGLDSSRHSSVMWSKASGHREVNLTVPRAAEEANYTFLCEAENSFGKAKGRKMMFIHRSKSSSE